MPRFVSSRTSASSARPVAKRGLLRTLVAYSAMLGAGALLVATSLPAVALEVISADATTVVASSQPPVDEQTLSVENTVLAGSAVRDTYTVHNVFAGAKGNSVSPDYLYTNDPNGTVQWPFPQAVPVSSGFGARVVANCSYCSTFHEGFDFVPGFGTPIGAISAGVVSQADTTGSYGNHVMIDHVINGQKVQSLYAHMVAGSITVSVGQTVTVAQVLGKVGNTGNSTGPHLHLEIHLDGTPIDPFKWLKANAN